MDRRRRSVRKATSTRRNRQPGIFKLPNKTAAQAVAGALLLIIVFVLDLIGVDLKQNIIFRDIDYKYVLDNIPKFQQSHDIAVFFQTPIEEKDREYEEKETSKEQTEPDAETSAPISENEISPEEDTETIIPEIENPSADADKLMFSSDAANKFTYLAVTDDRELTLLTDLMENDDTTFNPDELPKPEQVLKSAPKLAFSYVLPLKGYLSSGFGYREHPIEKEIMFHFGVDIAAPSNSTITAFAAGTVAETGYTSYYGNYIKVSHPGGILSFYGHCNKILVKKGQKVSKGGKIAYVGSTGASTGPHLHFEIRKGQTIINPEEYFKGKL